MIGQALMLAVAGRGHRAAAEQPGFPAATVHGWLRRAVALADPASEQLKDTWDPAVFGHPGGLSFTAITQPWLRQAAKVRADEELPRLRGAGAGNVREKINAIARLSGRLRCREHR